MKSTLCQSERERERNAGARFSKVESAKASDLTLNVFFV